MTDARKGPSGSPSAQRDQQQQKQQPVRDLDVRKDDVDKVKGGLVRRSSSDPCEGGE